MKKIIFFSLSFLLAFNAFAGVITTKMYVGPKSGGTCQNSKGICMVVTNSVNDALAFPVSMQLSEDQASITITISNTQYSNLPMELQADLDQGIFMQNAVCVLTQDICTLLGYAGSSLQITVKTYTVTHTTGGYVFVVNVVGQ